MHEMTQNRNLQLEEIWRIPAQFIVMTLRPGNGHRPDDWMQDGLLCQFKRQFQTMNEEAKKSKKKSKVVEFHSFFTSLGSANLCFLNVAHA